jgi:hypothetical protein
VEDHFAIVPLQNLLDHTTRRIVKSNLDLEAKMFQIAEQNGGQLSAILYYKYGFDGSGSHHRAMQPDAAGDQPEGKTLNAIQMGPLRLAANRGSEEIILYENERPNNPHSSRPVRLAFETENSASIQAKNQRLKQEINSLEKFVLSEDPKIEIKFTMVDGKVVSALTNQNTWRCNICDKSGPEMAKNEGPFSPVSEERLQFGASPLHLRPCFTLRTSKMSRPLKLGIQRRRQLLQKGQLLLKMPFSKS